MSISAGLTWLSKNNLMESHSLLHVLVMTTYVMPSVRVMQSSGIHSISILIEGRAFAGSCNIVRSYNDVVAVKTTPAARKTNWLQPDDLWLLVAGTKAVFILLGSSDVGCCHAPCCPPGRRCNRGSEIPEWVMRVSCVCISLSQSHFGS